MAGPWITLNTTGTTSYTLGTDTWNFKYETVFLEFQDGLWKTLSDSNKKTPPAASVESNEWGEYSL